MTRSGARGAGAVAICDRYTGILLDVDGVVRLGDQPVAGAGEAVTALLERGLGVAYVTNNAARTPETVAAAIRDVGVPAEADQVVTSSMAAADLLEPGTRCLIIGGDGLRQALAERGCREVVAPGDAEAVVVGFDHRFDFQALRRATFAVRAGARLIATNTDPTFPTADGLGPGNGAIVAAVETAAEQRAEVAGKPCAPLLEAAARRLPDGPLLMVGDRHATDIVGAAQLGWDTALVLTGVTTAAMVPGLDPSPTWVLDDLRGLLRVP